jgi:RHH-type proline utilization regulon transcriptional repressor/proline dehydrogenase/delta 1-pyrroline-5-carboxylate dehydrogenase
VTHSPADREILEVGRRLVGRFPARTRHPVRAADERAIELASQDAALRAALFRFVDVVPACRSPEELAAHLVGFLGEVELKPVPLDVAMRLSGTRAGSAALGLAAAAAVRHIAHRFIVAERPADAAGVLRELWDEGIGTSVDLLGEATVTATEAERYALRSKEALAALSAVYSDVSARAELEADSLGAIPRANLSVKVSALTPLLRGEAPELGERDAAPRLRELLRQAKQHGAHLHVDMESFDSREAITELVLSLLSEEEFRDGPSAGLVVQSYLVDSPALCERILSWAAAHERVQPLVVRLVKGAYWDHEVVDARQHGWSSPVFEDKSQCDRNFEALTVELLRARPLVRPAIASHNLRSVAHAIVADGELGGESRDLEFQVLRGLGDDIGHALAAEGYRVRMYCPIGDLIAGMAYLVRRLLENTSNESFLAERAHGRPLDELLAAP